MNFALRPFRFRRSRRREEAEAFVRPSDSTSLPGRLRCLKLFLSSALVLTAAEKSIAIEIDVAAIDRARILKAADTALKLEPITITKFRAKLSEGGPQD